MLDCVVQLTFGWETTTHLVQPDVHVGSAAPKTHPHSGSAVLSRSYCSGTTGREREREGCVC